jgi:hypothetical protein
MNPDPKPQTPRSQKYLDWLKEQPCCVCGTCKNQWVDIVPAHQTINGHGFLAGKASDLCALPLCSRCHASEHRKGVKSFWRLHDRKSFIIQHLIKFMQR